MVKNYKPNFVSVIIPCYNSARYLPEAIESVLSQSYRQFEIILVDDGSTDNTREVIERYRNNVFYHFKKNGGPGSARNLGINHARGEYIAFLDADDIWLPEKLSIQIDFLSRNNKFAIIHANTLVSEKEMQLYPFFAEKIPKSGSVMQELFLENFINNLTVVMRHDCFDAANGFDESKWLVGIEDYDLWLRSAMSFQIGYLDEIVSIYRIHDSNISDELKRIESQLLLLEKFKRQFQDIEKKFPGLFQKKADLLSYRWGCWLIKNGHFDDAKSKFRIYSRSVSLKFGCILGLIGCYLKTNVLCKDRETALHLKRYANYLWSKGDRKTARRYYRKSLKQYALQTTALKRIWGF